MNETNWTKYKQILSAIEKGCCQTSEIRERFGASGVYITNQLVKMGCISRVSTGFYRKIKDLPFTNES